MGRLIHFSKIILIRDKKSNPQGLPLFRFLKLIFENIKPGVKYVRIGRSEGYGLLLMNGVMNLILKISLLLKLKIYWGFQKKMMSGFIGLIVK